jgi:hypothetical protein
LYVFLLGIIMDLFPNFGRERKFWHSTQNHTKKRPPTTKDTLCLVFVPFFFLCCIVALLHGLYPNYGRGGSYQQNIHIQFCQWIVVIDILIISWTSTQTSGEGGSLFINISIQQNITKDIKGGNKNPAQKQEKL